MDGYDVVEAKKFQEMAFNQFMAYTYLDNADKTKYGKLLMGLNTKHHLRIINIQNQSSMQQTFSAIIIGIMPVIK
jgi:hypothetical protein